MNMDEAITKRAEPVSGQSTLSRRDLLIGGSLLATAGITFARLPRQQIVAVPGSIQKILPLRFDGWTGGTDEGFVMPPADELKAAAVYDEQLSLSYRNADGAQIMLLIAYARNQSGMLMIHRPESCYPGAGFTITSDRQTDIRLAPDKVVAGRFISAQHLPRIEQVLYWTRLGHDFAASWDEEREMLALQNLRGLVPDGALIRVSVIDADEQKSFDLLTRFVSQLYRASGPEGRALLVGPLSPA